MAYNTKHEDILLILLDDRLVGCRQPVELIAKVDNIQAIAAVNRGYRKNLKFLDRTHKCSIGAPNDLVDNGGMKVDYAPTATHRGDGFTKSF